jgi:YggT family protein
MLADTLNFFIQTLGGLFAVAVLLRFAMQVMRVPFSNPFAQFIVRITDFAVRPLRRMVPGWGGYDWASLLLAWLIEVVVVAALLWVKGFPFSLAGLGLWPVLLGLGALELLKLALYLVMGLTLLRALLSWVNPYSPVAPVIYPLTEPLLQPFRRMLPASQIDFSPLVLIILCQFLLVVPLAALERAALGAF